MEAYYSNIAQGSLTQLTTTTYTRTKKIKVCYIRTERELTPITQIHEKNYDFHKTQSRERWKDGSSVNISLHWCTDGSGMEQGLEARIFRMKSRTEVSLSLSNGTEVLQAETIAIHTITILTNNQAVVKVIGATKIITVPMGLRLRTEQASRVQ